MSNNWLYMKNLPIPLHLDIRVTLALLFLPLLMIVALDTASISYGQSPSPADTPTSPSGTIARPIMVPADRMEWEMRISVTPADASPRGGNERTPSGTGKAADTNAAPVTLKASAIHYTRADGITKIRVTTGNGPDTELWSVRQGILCQVGKGKIRLFSNGIPRYPYASSGFYGIEHMNAKDDQGEVTQDKIRCRHYKGARAVTTADRPFIEKATLAQEPPISYEAWFDAATGLPRMYRAEGKTFTFEFSPPPEKLALPAEWKAAMEKDLQNMRRAGLTP
jgi:hypothetical protein